MIVACDQAREIPGEDICKIKPNLPSNGNNSSTKDGKQAKNEADDTLLRKTAASIADALLSLGGSEDEANTPCHDQSTASRKRTVSLTAELDSSSTDSQSTNAENDETSMGPNKRLRKTSSRVICSIPTKLCQNIPIKSIIQDPKISMKSKLQEGGKERTACSSSNEFKIHYQNYNSQKLPGYIGCISQSYHKYFQPLRAAPRLPSYIVPEDPPPLPEDSTQTTFAPSGTMYSAAVMEHKDCVIMHSYAVLPPGPVSQHIALAQLPIGI